MPRTQKYQSNGERQAAYRRRCAQATFGSIPSVPGRRRWKAMLKAASALLECATTEMQEYFEAHSDTWQESQVGESLVEMLESAQDALASLDDIALQTRPAKAGIT
jgi:hypothetical protein